MAGTTIALHIRKQNAGILFNRSESSVHVEMFELSPNNEAVISTQGRLRRLFPGSSVAIPLSIFQSGEFQTTVAHTLSKMNYQSAYGTQPQVMKAGEMQDEDRDTTNPKMVTELFSAFLRSMGNPVRVSEIWKNTREEVFWKDGNLHPFHRSPLWLLIRVTLQLQFSRSEALECSEQTYKIFMLFFMTNILAQPQALALPTDILSAMSAKLSRRRKKLSQPVPQSLFSFVELTLSKTHETMQKGWEKVQTQDCTPSKLESLRNLKFHHDTSTNIPSLDEYIQYVSGRKEDNSPCTFEPSCPLYTEDEPRSTFSLESDYATFDLAIFEKWVASDLNQWLTARRTQPGTAGILRGLLERYHKAAVECYSKNPEALSIMILTVLELWIALDKAAIELHGLLSKYHPGIELGLLENLHLPLKKQMERLLEVERYLEDRCSNAEFGFHEVLSTSNSSFPVRYFDQCVELQNLLHEIEACATKDREAKRAEFRQKSDEYRDWMQRYDASNHEYESSGLWEWKHKYNCSKCAWKTVADNLKIEIHEWPLSEYASEAKAAIFELRVPGAFGHWRDSTIFVISDVLLSKYQDTQPPRARFPLDHEKVFLKRYFKCFDHKQRILLLSQNKPQMGTHRSMTEIINKTEDDVCLKNGLHLQYYDKMKDCFTSGLTSTQEIAKLCTYTLPAPLQQFIFRPKIEPDGPSPNTVLATQSTCPDDLSLEEYKALTSLPLGCKIQWQNILVQIASPSVDFNMQATLFVVMQCILQTGPRSGDGDVRRSGHGILTDVQFANALLDNLNESLRRIEMNWKSFHALCIFVSIARRLLSLTSASAVELRSLEILALFRDTAMKWVHDLQEKVQGATDDKIRNDLRSKVVDVALIGADTFNIDENHLQSLLTSSPKDACTMIQFAIAIKDGVLRKPTKYLTSIMFQRWEQLAFRSFGILVEQVASGSNPALDNAINAIWSSFHASGQWEALGNPYHHWLCSKSAPSNGCNVLEVHFSLLTGELLINGSPLSRLPGNYERNDIYPTLFGRSILEVAPSDEFGFRFSCKNLFHKHSLNFGLDKEENLSVRATNENRTFELIPRSVLKNSFPTMFVDNFVHWYNLEDDWIEFCTQEFPWDHSERNWMLRHGLDSGWQLVKGDALLINMKSPTAKAVANILSPLETLEWTHITLHGLSLDVELPRLQLGFHLKQGETMITSHQFRRMSIDEDQLTGTLIGLRDKLVLKDVSNQARKIIIPNGAIRFIRAGQHVQVTVDKGSATRVHAYDIDVLLGRLVDDGSLQSKLLISYLHALTSFPLPDPLTRMNGTEQALTILKSAAVQSFKWLTKEDHDLLIGIALLTPKRKYYPDNEQVMQTVTWNPSLGFLAQHSQFYQVVLSILNKAKSSKFFYEDSYVTPPTIDHVMPGLLRRDLIRSSAFRVSGFGAEDHTDSCDITYKERDRGQNSKKASRAFIMSSIVFREQFSLYRKVPENLGTMIWNFILRHNNKTNGPKQLMPMSEVNYDGGLLQNWAKRIAQDLIPFQCLLSTASPRPSKFQVMLWLATLSFAEDPDMTILQTLASFFAAGEMATVTAPAFRNFNLAYGYEFHQSKLLEQLKSKGSYLTFEKSPEARFMRSQGKYNMDFQQSQKRLFDENKVEKLEELSNALASQWPRRSPTRPEETNSAGWCEYIKMDQAMREAEYFFKPRYDNYRLVQYLDQISNEIPRHINPVNSPPFSVVPLPLNLPRKRGFIGNKDLFCCQAPVELSPDTEYEERDLLLEDNQNITASNIAELLSRLDKQAESEYERKYIEDLRRSGESLQGWRKEHRLTLAPDKIKELLERLRDDCLKVVNGIYDAMVEAVESGQEGTRGPHWPRISPIFFLQRLTRKHWQKISEGWKKCIVRYGEAITQLQRAERLLGAGENPHALVNELRNAGHTAWRPIEYPEWLLLEIESGILIRPVQAQIAASMMNPETGSNAVMQLNMGEGKSSVIVPLLSAALADGSQLVRVIVGKPQSKQMYSMLVSKLGGLLDRRIYHMPFTRAVKVGYTEVQAMKKMFEDCSRTGSIFLVQPEHILSFKLMGIECTLTGKDEIGKALIQSQHDLDVSTRDIVDESDENFSVKFELVYTMGTQRPTEHSPERWICAHQVLDIVKQVVMRVRSELPSSIEVHSQSLGCFPLTRILESKAGDRILHQVAEHICATGLKGFPVTRQRERIRKAVERYIVNVHLEAADIELVEDQDENGFWASASQTLLLLRGLIAGGVLEFAFSSKRWRVDYGLDPSRRPSTKLAVPYRAKDNPSPRSEFSHPDVVIVLTSLSYYYGGIDEEDLYHTFDHLLKSDQAGLEYDAWKKDAHDAPALDSINLEDRAQFTQQVYPTFRYAKGVIDYFLCHIVFPKEMKEFPQKLSASGWDTGEEKKRLTTGFSGTNDSRKVLPLSITQLDLETQKHTNALVLENLLRPENSVHLMRPRREVDGSMADMLLDIITAMEQPTRVILDVGAQILELSNRDVAKAWLSKISDASKTEAAIYFDDEDEMRVLDRKDHDEPLQTSPFSTHLDACLVFLDEAHTRGTDLKLPRNYRAAVTLGANLTKDRLVQGK